MSGYYGGGLGMTPGTWWDYANKQWQTGPSPYVNLMQGGGGSGPTAADNQAAAQSAAQPVAQTPRAPVGGDTITPDWIRNQPGYVPPGGAPKLMQNPFAGYGNGGYYGNRRY